jgi:hypothetical protein
MCTLGRRGRPHVPDECVLLQTSLQVILWPVNLCECEFAASFSYTAGDAVNIGSTTQGISLHITMIHYILQQCTSPSEQEVLRALNGPATASSRCQRHHRWYRWQAHGPFAGDIPRPALGPEIHNSTLVFRYVRRPTHLWMWHRMHCTPQSSQAGSLPTKSASGRVLVHMCSLCHSGCSLAAHASPLSRAAAIGLW